MRVPGEFNRPSGERIATGIRAAIDMVGESADREGLRDTPDRWRRAFEEMTAGYKDDPKKILSVAFASPLYDEMIVLAGITFTSLCEHHLLPFTGTADVGYIGDGYRVVGLSKLARLVECYSRRLQIQERMTIQITSALGDYLKVKGAACIIRAEHSCMACRGVKKPGAEMITSSMTGIFAKKAHAKAEFMELCRRR